MEGGPDPVYAHRSSVRGGTRRMAATSADVRSGVNGAAPALELLAPQLLAFTVIPRQTTSEWT